MRFRLTEHAESELARRGVPRGVLDQVLAGPEQIVPVDRGRRAYQSRIDFGGGRVYLVRAIVQDDVDPAIVITVYRTSKIAKYWRAT